jgi:uncharacterized protein (DUF362 family)
MTEDGLPVLEEYRRLDRRELLRRWAPPAAAGVALAAFGLAFTGRDGRHRPQAVTSLQTPPDWRTDPMAKPRLATAAGHGPEENLQRVLAALGGMEAFVRKGERVAIKPNCAWDRTPEQAANTDPELVGALVRQCFAAGAGSVVVVDNSCHDPSRVFVRSGIEQAAKSAGGEVAHQRSAGTVKLDLGGTVLGAWDVLQPIARADRVINVPVVKHHSLSRATLGMKNWMGAIVGRRANLHQRIAQSCAELGAAFKPTLTVIDATRVLTGGGPTGGSLALVRADDRIAASTDQVAADAWGAGLLGLTPDDMPHLAIAERLGLGTSDWKAVEVETG